MEHRDSTHFSARNIIKTTTAADGTQTPNLNLVNVFRYASPLYNLIIGLPENARDGQYIRIEVVSAAAKTVNFNAIFLVNGAVIADANHDADALVIYHGYYDADAVKWNLIKIGSKAA